MRRAHRRLAHWLFCLDDEPAVAGPRVWLQHLEDVEDNLDPQIALRDFGVVGVVKLQRPSESENVLLTPVSSPRGSDLRLRGMAAPITMGGQHGRVSLTRDYGADDPHAGFSRHVGHHVMELDVHLHQRLLHMLDVRRTVVQQALTLAQIGAQRGQLALGSEAGAQQPIFV